MAVSEPPADLIQLRRDLSALEARRAELCRATPPDALHDDAQLVRLAAAFSAMTETADAIARHRWWAHAGNRPAAEETLRAAAG